MSNTLGGDTLAATMCTMTDMQEIEVAEEYTKGFLGTEIGIDTAGNGWWPDNIWELITAVVAIIVVIAVIVFLIFNPEIILGIVAYFVGDAFVTWVVASSPVWLMEAQNLWGKLTPFMANLSSIGNFIMRSPVGKGIEYSIDSIKNYLTVGFNSLNQMAIYLEQGYGGYKGFWAKCMFNLLPYKLVDAGYGLVTDTPELINDIKNGDVGEFSTDFVSDILMWSNPLNPMPNISNDIRQNYFEDSWLGFSFDEFFGGE